MKKIELEHKFLKPNLRQKRKFGKNWETPRKRSKWRRI